MTSSPEASPPRWLLYLKALRAFSFPISLLPVLVGVAAVRPPNRWNLGILAAELAGVLFLHAGGNLVNDVCDYRSGADRRTHDDENRPGRFLVRGELQPGELLAEACLCFLLFVPCLLYLLLRVGPGILAFGAIGLFGAWAYTAPPFNLKYRALGELAIFVVFGPALVLGAAYAQTGRLELEAFLFSLPVGCATAAVLAGNNLRDAEEDAGARIRTLAHVIGAAAQKRFYVTLVVTAVALAPTLGFLRHRAPLVLCAAPLTLLSLAPTLRALARGKRIPDIDAKTARFATLLYLLIALGLAVSTPYPPPNTATRNPDPLPRVTQQTANKNERLTQIALP